MTRCHVHVWLRRLIRKHESGSAAARLFPAADTPGSEWKVPPHSSPPVSEKINSSSVYGGGWIPSLPASQESLCLTESTVKWRDDCTSTVLMDLYSCCTLALPLKTTLKSRTCRGAENSQSRAKNQTTLSLRTRFPARTQPGTIWSLLLVKHNKTWSSCAADDERWGGLKTWNHPAERQNSAACFVLHFTNFTLLAVDFTLFVFVFLAWTRRFVPDFVSN